VEGSNGGINHLGNSHVPGLGPLGGWWLYHAEVGIKGKEAKCQWSGKKRWRRTKEIGKWGVGWARKGCHSARTDWDDHGWEGVGGQHGQDMAGGG